MWTYLKKRRALRSYKTTLATKLRKRYGRERHYTPEQVKTTAQDAGVSMVFLCFAFAMFCERDAFDAYHLAAGESCDYLAMRTDIAPALGIASGASTTFDATDFQTADDAGHHGPDFGGGFDVNDGGPEIGGCGCGGGCGGD